jgi:hypothetical protein
LKLRHADLDSDPRDWQFGIRQLMIVTALVAVLLGIGRWVVSTFGERPVGVPWAGLAFMVVAAAVVSLPPLLAVLLRYAIWPTLDAGVAARDRLEVWSCTGCWCRLIVPPFLIVLNPATVAQQGSASPPPQRPHPRHAQAMIEDPAAERTAAYLPVARAKSRPLDGLTFGGTRGRRYVHL